MIPTTIEVKKFECPECTKVFGKKEHLVRHARSHTLSKPYACSVCNKCFGRRDVLTRHERTAHIEGSVSNKRKAANKFKANEDGTSNRRKTNQQQQQLLVDVASNQDINNMNGFASTSTLIPDQFMNLSTKQHDNINGINPSNLLLQSQHERDLDSLLGFIQPTFSNNVLAWPEADEGIYEFFDTGMPDLMMGSGVDYFSVVGSVGGGELGMMNDLGAFGVGNSTNSVLGGGLDHHHQQPLEPLFPLLPPEILVPEPESKHWSSIMRDWPTHLVSFTTAKRRPQSLGLYPLELDPVSLSELMTALEAESDPLIIPSNSTSTSPPSPDLKLLSLSLAHFWSFISPSFPILHRATFRPTRFPLLTLALASVGVTYIDNRRARDMGVHLYEGLRDLVWFGGLERGGMSGMADEEVEGGARNVERGEGLAMLQSGFLVLLNGCLRGDQMSLHSSNMHLSSLINYARTLGVFTKSLSIGTIEVFRPGDDSEGAWLDWISSESLKRIGHGLLWQSSFLSGIFHHSTSPSIQTLTIEWPASQELFAAQTSSEWRVLKACAFIFQLPQGEQLSVRETVLDLLTSNTGNSISNHQNGIAGAVSDGIPERLGSDERLLSSTGGKELNLSLVLSMICLVAHTLEHGQVIWDPDTRNGRATRNALASWYRCWLLSDRLEGGNGDVEISMAFHFGNLHVLAPFEAIESVCGRDGYQLSTNTLSVTQIRAWVQTPLARKAVLHAGQLWVLCSSVQRRKPGGLMLAHIALQSALLLWVYERFLPPSTRLTPSLSNPLPLPLPIIELSQPVDWSSLDDSSSSSDLILSPSNQNIKDFIDLGGNCSLAGVVLANGDGGEGAEGTKTTHILESFASQLEGSSCWGQTGQVIRLLNLLADNEF